jgi:hypothetical protein
MLIYYKKYEYIKNVNIIMLKIMCDFRSNMLFRFVIKVAQFV